MDRQPEPHEKRDLAQGGAPAPPAAGTVQDAAATRTPPNPAPDRAPMSRQQLERLRRKLKARFH